MITVGIDPALNSPGIGVLHDGELVAAANVRIPESVKELEMGERIRTVARAIVHWFHSYTEDQPAEWLAEPLTVVYECPQVYGPAASLGDPNDLIPLAEVAAAVTYELAPERIVRVKPREWTAGTSKTIKVGNRKKLPKSVWSASRGMRVRMILTKDELELIPDQHDALDGVCLALHATPRALATPRRVMPGASPRRTPPL